ncbi:sulfonate ABC transporter substrate-binding protein [Nordella sp. HKS 07]|nr:sulfonate ABC transporter substrate-binding protein [Nordella sp. HKS 07]QIG49310.1 sulfonate ABC transporter substrate-binding protein [Nordella sp. HKS 07]
MITRRQFTHFATAALAGLAAGLAPLNAAPLREFRIGYQKSGILVVTRQQKLIEKKLEAQGIAVKWVEFAAGPPLLEALNAGAIDFGYTGDSPPIFAQAASANLVYVATLPSTGSGSAIIVPKDSKIQSLADLKGRTVGFTKGSSAHFLTIQALKKGGLVYGNITPAYLSPADAGAAFAKGAIDAWTIWDPYLAIAEKTQNARILVPGEEIGPTNSFLFANKDFAAANPLIVKEVVGEIAVAVNWSETNRDKVAAAISAVTGVPLDIQKIAVARTSYALSPVTESQIASQQRIADTFYELKLIPKPIVVRDVVWTAPQS